jgi:two-component system chemotaxis response regulator CheB
MGRHPGRDIVVVAASAGGLIPLRRFLSLLPADLPASILVVLHIPATGGQALPRILDRSGPLAASVPADGAKLAHGRVFVAPPDRHVLVVNGAVRLSRGPRQNGVRPAGDPLFRSAALYGGPRTVAVVLSGTLDDAALGSAVVEQCGGRVLVQDPEEAAYPGMPSSTLAATRHAVSLPVDELADHITQLATADADLVAEGLPAELERALRREVSRLLDGDLEVNLAGHPYSGFSCPDCGGPLYFGRQDDALTYDCVVGHNWSPQSLLEGQSVAVERALWLAIRSLDERARLTTRLSDDALDRGRRMSAGHFRAAADEAWQAADQIRKVVNGLLAMGTELDDPAGSGDSRVSGDSVPIE